MMGDMLCYIVYNNYRFLNLFTYSKEDTYAVQRAYGKNI